jgi:hypothetical protein
MRNLPFRDFEHNRVWLELVRIAHDLICWTQQLLLTGELAKANLAALLFEYLPPMMTPLSRPSSSHIATIASRPVSRRRPRGGQRRACRGECTCCTQDRRVAMPAC